VHLSRVKYVAAGGGGVGVGFVAGKLSGGDFKALLSQALDGTFKFLHEQGAYASFAIVMATGFGFLAVWCIRMLVNGKQAEIDRIAADRDKFQKLLIEQWQSSVVPPVPVKDKKK
jgi:hypothetical protein